MRARITALLALLLVAAPAAAYDVDVIQDNGDPANRIDVVILGDGYRDVDQQQLIDNTNWFLSSFWSETPYGEYRSYFNVKLVHVISVDNGADNGTYGVDRDTALGAYYNCNGIDRLLCVNGGAVYSVANSHVPEWDVIFVIVNDPKYGGAGGSYAVFSIHPSAGEVALHEFGHTFAGLADEYETAYPGYPQCGADCPEPNATNHSVRDEVKWNPWIDPQTPVPTPEGAGYSGDVGVFEGCRYFSSGVYRPKENCKMRSLGPAFCEVCSEATLWNIYAEVDPIDATDPASPLALTGCETAVLSVAHLAPDPDTMLVSWFVDGQPVQTGGLTYTLEAFVLGDGAHTATVRVEDTTTIMLRDPWNVRASEFSWQVDVSGAGQGACMIDAVCYADGALDPANPCQECVPANDPFGWTPDDSNTCGDGEFCNGTESCAGGTCTDSQPPCADDGLACTDTCDEASDSCNLLQPGWCLIDGACVADGTINPGNHCQSCQAAVASDGWSAYDAGDCSDGLFCNGAESCQAGACVSGASACVDDGLACTDTCDEAGQACNQLQAGWCLIAGTCVADGSVAPDNPCQACLTDVAADGWSAYDAGDCDDGDFCNGAEACSGGACQAGQAPCADDGLACTDTCDEVADACDALRAGWCVVDGACAADGAVHPDNPCLACDPDADPTAWTPDDAAACDDARPCTENDRCEAGACVGDLIPGCCTVDLDCDDGLTCTVDTCDPGASTCTSTQAADTCLIGGTCYASGDPDPVNACRTCQPDQATDAFVDADGLTCDDGDACTEGETCQAGACVEGERICSDDCPCDLDGGIDGGSDGGGGGEDKVKGGCGCAASGTGGPLGLILIGLLGLALRRRG